MTDTIRARPTTYAGIKMRSRLEASYAQHLDSVRLGWEYEPECFADETGQYLPDFLLRKLESGPYDEVGKTYIEVKPHPILRDQAKLAAALQRMEIIWASHPHACLVLEVGHDVPGLSEPKFLTQFIAPGQRFVDERGMPVWSVISEELQIPMVWDRAASIWWGPTWEREHGYPTRDEVM